MAVDSTTMQQCSVQRLVVLLLVQLLVGVDKNHGRGQSKQAKCRFVVHSLGSELVAQELVPCASDRANSAEIRSVGSAQSISSRETPYRLS